MSKQHLKAQLKESISRVPVRVRNGSVQQVHHWKEAATKAMAIINGKRATEEEMRALLRNLE